MASSCFIGTTSSEPSGKSNKEVYEDYISDYRLNRKKAGMPSYIMGIDWGYVRTGRIPVIIGGWK